MSKLKSEFKRMIVQRLATFVAPSEIIAELKTLGVDVSASQVVYYDPTSANDGLAKEWRDLHATTRAAFLKDATSIAVSHKSYRIQELGDMYRQAKQKKNFVLAADLLERVAKEMGEAYTNKRVIETGDPVDALAKLLGATPEAISAALSDIGDAGVHA